VNCVSLMSYVFAVFRQ